MNTLMYKSEYEKMYYSENTLWWYKGLRAVMKDAIESHAAQNAYILDAGCGTGKNIAYLTALGYPDVQGFDYADDAIKYCKIRGLNQVVKGDITAIAYDNNTFDVVCCIDVLGSLEAPERSKAIAEIYRVLKPGGIIIGHTAALELFRSQHDDVANIKLRFNKQQFEQLCSSTNTEILKSSYRVFLLAPLVLIFKLIKKLTGLAKASGESTSDQVQFPALINKTLSAIQLFENRLLKKFNFPFGSSVFIVARKIS